ncbi:Glycosyltransferase [Rhodovulum sp. P5]|uniref:glycosyltransferase n=1 Tax=Rhodovulum sp. P5 TaxID=1564506 RepID=UPI0009C363AF|nr:glycosyltransferase [Rhodovulum sp. P5]ARE41309.1 Glycosyltransferase [Rhodovulum sp. P5]
MSLPKKVLGLIPTRGFGGAEMHALTLARWLKSNGSDVTLAFDLCAGTLPLLRQCNESGIDVIDAPIAPPIGASPMEIHEAQGAIVAARIDFAKYDLAFVAAPSPATCIGILPALAASGLPAIVVFHLVAEGLRLSEAVREVFAASLRPWLSFVAVSEFTRDMLAAALGLPAEAGFVGVIANGVQIERTDAPINLPSVIGVDDARIVASIGRLHPQKGCATLVDAIPHVVSKIPNAHFLWFGDGELGPSMRERAERLEVGQHLHLMGFSDRPVDIMAAADVVALPSRYEGLSLTLLEAMHAGAVIVTTETSYQERILTEGVDASIVPRDDAVSLGGAVAQLLGDPAACDSYRINVQQRAQDFTLARMLDDYRILMERLVEARANTVLGADTAGGGTSCILRVEVSLGATGLSMAVVDAQGGRHSLPLHGLFEDDISRLLEGCESAEVQADLGGELEYVGSGALPNDAGPVTAASLLLRLLGAMGPYAPAAVMALHEAFGQVFVGRLAETPSLSVDCIEDVLDGLEAVENGAGLSPLRLANGLLTELKDARLRDRVVSRLATAVVSEVKSDTVKDAPPDAAAALRIGQGQIADLPLQDGERARFFASVTNELGGAAEARRFRLLARGLGTTGPASSGRTPGRVTVFAEFFNFPARNGGDGRILSLILAYRRIGLDVTVCLLVHEGKWSEKCRDAERLRTALNVEVDLVPLSDKASARLRRAHQELAQGNGNLEGFFDQQAFAQIRAYLEAARPDILHVNYCYFGWVALAAEGLVPHRVLDTHDIISRRTALLREIRRRSQDTLPTSCASVPAILHADAQFAALRYDLHPAELPMMGSFETVLMISPQEAADISGLLPAGRVVPLQMHLPFVPLTRYGTRKAMFAAGRNVFNILGAAAIQNHVASYLAARNGGQDMPAQVEVYGDVCGAMEPGDGMVLHGRVPNVAAAYEDAAVAFCPVPAGTGQNVKIVEALSRGLPVLTYASIGRNAGVQPGVNGLLYGSIDDMRRGLADLLDSPDQLAALQASTRDWAARRYSSGRFVADLAKALRTTGCQLQEVERLAD